jgi:hypothetical protein
MTITKQQRKAILISLGVLIGSYVVRSLINGAMQMAYYQQQASRAAQRPKPKAQPPAAVHSSVAAASPTSPTLAIPVPQPQPSPFSKLTGVWHGRAVIPGKGLCNLRFELRESEPGHFSGYPSLVCSNVTSLMSRQVNANPASNLLNSVDPAAAILTGTVDNGAIHLHADKTIGTDINGCAMSSFTLTPFGKVLLAAEWQEGTCQGGHLIMERAR